jgi:integrase
MQVEQTTETTKKPRRERGTGRIWQDGAIWWIQYYVHGQQVRESSGSEKKTVAEKLLEKRLSEKKAGVLRVTSADKLRYEKMRDCLYAKYRNEGQRSLRKAKGEDSREREWVAGVYPHLDNYFAGWRASEITTEAMRKFIDKRLAEGAAKGTINGSLAALSSMFWLAFKGGLLRRDDIPHFPLFRKLDNQRWIRLNPEEFERLRSALPEHLKAPTRLAYFNGLRREEVFGLQWSDVDWDAGVIRLSGKVTKTGEPRMTPIPPPVLADLKALFPKRTPGLGFVFENDGRRIQGFRKAWRSALKRAKLPEGFVFHGLRYCAASNLTSAGVPQALAQRITGHKTGSIWKRYNLSSEADIAEAGARVAAYIENGEKKGRMTDSQPPEEAVKQELPF